MEHLDVRDVQLSAGQHGCAFDCFGGGTPLWEFHILRQVSSITADESYQLTVTFGLSSRSKCAVMKHKVHNATAGRGI